MEGPANGRARLPIPKDMNFVQNRDEREKSLRKKKKAQKGEDREEGEQIC